MILDVYPGTGSSYPYRWQDIGTATVTKMITVMNNGTNGNGRITNKQISAIFAISRERGMSNADVRSLSKEMFNRNVDYLSKHEASSLIEHLLGQ